MAKRVAKATISPRRNGCLHAKDQQRRASNTILQSIRDLQGRKRKGKDWGLKQWKQESGYLPGPYRIPTRQGAAPGFRSSALGWSLPPLRASGSR